ncbi:MAG TPA: hypothetical protein DCY62_13910 [Thalassospira sp.]|nr:hypothetical protein [Thalassospira sp.]
MPGLLFKTFCRDVSGPCATNNIQDNHYLAVFIMFVGETGIRAWWIIAIVPMLFSTRSCQKRSF